MINISKLVRPNILNLKPYSSARSEFSGKEGIFGAMRILTAV